MNLDFLQDKALLVAVAWITRECHLWWPSICQVYPYVVANGGVIRIVARFLYVPDPSSPPIPPKPPIAN